MCTQHGLQRQNIPACSLLSSYTNTEKEAHVSYIHKFRYLFLEVLKVAVRNTRGKKQEKKLRKNDIPVLITYFLSTSISFEPLPSVHHLNYFSFERFISVLLTFQINVTASHFNLAQNHVTGEGMSSPMVPFLPFED